MSLWKLCIVLAAEGSHPCRDPRSDQASGQTIVHYRTGAGCGTQPVVVGERGRFPLFSCIYKTIDRISLLGLDHHRWILAFDPPHKSP